MLGETIAAISTAPGRGAVAVVRVSGPEAWCIAEKLTGQPMPTPRIAALRTVRHGETILDEVLLLTFRAPHSYTGEDVVEFQCHGGAVTPRRILSALLSVGARLARRGEFTERAFLNGRLDYEQARGIIDLIDAKTERAADAARAGISGDGRRERAAIYTEMLDVSARIEHSLDVDEGELPIGFVADVHGRIDHLRNRLRMAIRRERSGKILREGALIVLAGPPNAGKSSLLNALLGESRAIVSDVPGTTRDSIEEWLDVDGWPARLVDTAGLRGTDDAIESEGVRRSRSLIALADVVLDLGGNLNLPRALRVHTKCDLGRGEGLNVSSVTGEGLDDLRHLLAERLADLAARADETGGDIPEVAALHETLAALEGTCTKTDDLVLLGNALRTAAERLGEALGTRYSADLLDRLFSRFCVGK